MQGVISILQYGAAMVVILMHRRRGSKRTHAEGVQQFGVDRKRPLTSGGWNT